MAMSGLIDRMESKDLVSRSEDSSDKRIKRVFLTRNARKLIPDMQVIAHRLYSKSMASLNAKDLQTTKRVLGKITGNLQDLTSDS